MQSQRTISFRIDPEKVEALDSIAKALDRDRSYLLNQAVEGYLLEQRQFAALIEEGLEASRQGRLLEDEDVAGLIDSWTVEAAAQEKACPEKA
jgi:predicted transcriptional regulator